MRPSGCGAADLPPGSNAMRLDDFLNPPAPPLPPLRQAFEDHVATVMRVRDLPRLEAERVAFGIVLTGRLNATHPNTPSGRCAHCGKPQTPAAILLPIGAGERHAWLHRDCWGLWREQRRAETIAELAKAGVRA